MRVLLDTHVLLWALSDPARLGREAREVLESREHQIFFSAASIWEIAIKAKLLRMEFGVDADAIVTAAEEVGFTVLPIWARHAAGVAALAPHHKDPFDRLLVSQSIVESTRLMTTDRVLADYSKDLVWLLKS